MLQPIKITKKEQAKNLLYLFKGFIFVNSSHLPFLLLCLNGLGYGLGLNYIKYYSCKICPAEPEYIRILDLIGKNICDISLISLIILICINYKWSKITWAAYITLCLLYLTNTYFEFILGSGEYDYDLNANYFSLSVVFIYLGFFCISMCYVLRLNNYICYNSKKL